MTETIPEPPADIGDCKIDGCECKARWTLIDDGEGSRSVVPSPIPELLPASAFTIEAEFYGQFTRDDLPPEESKRRIRLLRQMGRTPVKLFWHLDQEFGFELDAHADKFNALRPRFNTEEEPNRHPHAGNVFDNPPFKLCGAAARVAHYEALQNRATTVMIVTSSINSKWMHDHGSKATEIRVPRGRIQYDPPPSLTYSTAAADGAILVFRRGQLNLSGRWNVIPCDRETGRVL